MSPPPATAVAAAFVADSSRHRFTFQRRRRTFGGRKNKRTREESKAEVSPFFFLPKEKIHRNAHSNVKRPFTAHHIGGVANTHFS